MQFLYEFLKLIPENNVTTYKQIWEIFWIHPRKIAKILEQNQKQDLYPCYKVINTNWEIGWYNLWIKEKIKRLQEDWIKIVNDKVDKNYFWKPKFKNFFCAIPLEWKQLEKFQKLANELEEINNWSFTIQKETSPHITLKFFWDIDLETFHKIITDTENLKLPKKEYILFNKLNNFSWNVYFLDTDYTKSLEKLYDIFHKITWLEKDKREFIPHLTIARIKNQEKFQKIKKQFEYIVSNYYFWIKLDKIRFYLAVDNNFQIPIKDILIK